MSIKRDDLRVEYPIDYRGNSPRTATRPATDEDLAALRYVKLDVDVDELWSSLVNPKAWESVKTWRRLTLQVLAALGEET